VQIEQFWRLLIQRLNETTEIVPVIAGVDEAVTKSSELAFL
jgi:hypothetical protein